MLSPLINIMQLEYLKEDKLYTGDKPLEFILVPKCPLFRDSTVYYIVPHPFHVNNHSNGISNSTLPFKYFCQYESEVIPYV